MHSSAAESIEIHGSWRATSVSQRPPATVSVLARSAREHIIIAMGITPFQSLQQSPDPAADLPSRVAFLDNVLPLIHSGTRALKSMVGCKLTDLINPY